MALSGKVGASALGLKIKACTPSLNFETCFSICSAEKLSDTSQPVRSVSAPRLAPPVMKRRRERSDIALVASRTRSFLSTPGMSSERMRPMIILLSATDDHGAQTFRHQQCERDVNHDESNDQGHTDEVYVTRGVIAAEHRRQILKLHRLPYRQAR